MRFADPTDSSLEIFPAQAVTKHRWRYQSDRTAHLYGGVADTGNEPAAVRG
jgi:hypothetical protein